MPMSTLLEMEHLIEHLTVSLKTLGISQPAAYSLPEELVVEVFETVLNGSRNAAVDFKRISHVCRLWRGICFSSPSLCSFSLDLRHDPIERVLEMIERSKAVPLSLYLDLPVLSQEEESWSRTQQVVDNVNAALSSESSSCAVEIIAPGSFFQRIQSSLNRVTSLQELKLVNRTDTESVACPQLVDVTYPNLRSLQLQGFEYILWTGSPCLTFLNLGGVDPASRAPLASIVGLLVSFPMLQYLRLDGIIDGTGPLPDLQDGIVPLWELRVLQIRDHLDSCTPFMAALLLPLDAHLDITCKITTRSYEIFPLVDSIRPFMHEWITPDAEHIAWIVSERIGFVVSCTELNQPRFPCPDEVLAVWRYRDFAVTFEFCFMDDIDRVRGANAIDLSSTVDQLYSRINLWAIPNMRLTFDDTAYSLSAPAGAAISRAAGGVTHLELIRPPPSLFSRAFGSGMLAVRILHVEGLVLAFAKYPVPRLFFFVFYEWLRYRSTITVLRMTDCVGMTSDHAAVFRNLVQYFYWDKKETGEVLPVHIEEEEDV